MMPDQQLKDLLLISTSTSICQYLYSLSSLLTSSPYPSALHDLWPQPRSAPRNTRLFFASQLKRNSPQRDTFLATVARAIAYRSFTAWLASATLPLGGSSLGCLSRKPPQRIVSDLSPPNSDFRKADRSFLRSARVWRLHTRRRRISRSDFWRKPCGPRRAYTMASRPCSIALSFSPSSLGTLLLQMPGSNPFDSLPEPIYRSHLPFNKTCRLQRHAPTLWGDPLSPDARMPSSTACMTVAKWSRQSSPIIHIVFVVDTRCSSTSAIFQHESVADVKATPAFTAYQHISLAHPPRKHRLTSHVVAPAVFDERIPTPGTEPRSYNMLSPSLNTHIHFPLKTHLY